MFSVCLSYKLTVGISWVTYVSDAGIVSCKAAVVSTAAHGGAATSCVHNSGSFFSLIVWRCQVCSTQPSPNNHAWPSSSGGLGAFKNSCMVCWGIVGDTVLSRFLWAVYHV